MIKIVHRRRLFRCVFKRWNMVEVAEWAMLVPECIALFTAVCCFLCSSAKVVKTFSGSTCLYNYNFAASTWSHVWVVELYAPATTKQTPKNVANPKSNRPQLQSCADSKTENPTQRAQT